MIQSVSDKGPGLTVGSKSTLIVAALLTVAWLAFSYHFLAARFPCESVFVVSCINKASDWGDFFAGAFSPLAFVWLVVAVILQSMELKAQRHELALTRGEFQESRAVAQAQTEESKRQAEFIGEQTEILRNQHQQAMRDSALVQFDASIEVLAARLISYDHCWDFTYHGEQFVKFRLPEYADQSDRRIIIGASQALRSALRHAAEKASGPAGSLRASYPNDFLKVYRSLVNSIETAKLLDGAAQQLASDLEMEDLQKNMDALMAASGNL
jgi:hypothetical protein